MSTTAITNQLTIIYSGIKDAEGGMTTETLRETFTDEVSEAKWITEMRKRVSSYPEHWGASYSFKRV